jgi:catechol 2,3-dioxygenase-like lactoylglutathione lyase family enzyme
MDEALIVERVDFVSLLTQDIRRAKQFYAETLGLEIETEGADDMEFRVGQVTLDIFNPASQGNLRAQPRRARPACPGRCRRAAALEAKGVEFVGETLDTGVCHMAFFRDPDGNALMLHRRYAPR